MSEEEVPASHQALRLCKLGRMSGKDMIEAVVAGRMYVPTTDLPEITEGRITGWRPVTASKADGSQWLLAFTLRSLVGAYCDANPHHGFYMEIDGPWVMRNVPDGWGIVFNLRTEDMLEWSPAGLAKYRKDVLGL